MILLHNLRHDTRADGTAAFANGEAQTLFHGDGVNQFHVEGGVVARHNHFHALIEGDHAGDVRGTEVELGTITSEERGMTSALFLVQDIDFALELAMRRDGAGLGQNLTALDIVAFDAAQEHADVVASLTLIEDFTEHLDTGASRLDRVFDADDGHFVTDGGF